MCLLHACASVLAGAFSAQVFQEAPAACRCPRRFLLAGLALGDRGGKVTWALGDRGAKVLTWAFRTRRCQQRSTWSCVRWRWTLAFSA
jgi:predicted acyltransferase